MHGTIPPIFGTGSCSDYSFSVIGDARVGETVFIVDPSVNQSVLQRRKYNTT